MEPENESTPKSKKAKTDAVVKRKRGQSLDKGGPKGAQRSTKSESSQTAEVRSQSSPERVDSVPTARSAASSTPPSSSPVPSSTPSSGDAAPSPINGQGESKVQAGPTKNREEFTEGIENLLGGDWSSSEDHGHYQPVDLVRIVVPVTACILMVVVMTILTTPPGEKAPQPFMALTPFNTPKADAATVAMENFANVGILLGVVVLLTFAILGLYLRYCYKVLYIIMGIPVVMVNLVFAWFYMHQMFRVFNTPLDHITAVIVTLNFGVIGCLSVLGRAPKILQQIYLLYLCAIMAVVYIDKMPQWTIWIFLGALAIWDLIAVLTPCGPLRILVETIQNREHDFVPAMVYSTVVFTMADADGPKEEAKKSKEKEKKKGKKDAPKKSKDDKDDKSKDGSGEPKKTEKKRLRLGLGDFVFYSLLIGQSAKQYLQDNAVVDWTVLLACIIAVLTGLLATVILLVLFKKALPALPISITFGLIFHFAGMYVISQFGNLMAANQVFI